MSRETWRDKARPIIQAVIAKHGIDDLRTLRRALRDAYPWGPRQYHPYKIWCDEVRVQLGLKPEPEPTPSGDESLPLFD